MPSCTFDDTTFEVPVATTLQRFAILPSGRYGIVLASCTILVLLSRCLSNEHASYAIRLVPRDFFLFPSLTFPHNSSSHINNGLYAVYLPCQGEVRLPIQQRAGAV